MHIFEIKVSSRGNVKTDPRNYHVPKFSADDFIFTMSDKNQDDYDISDISLKTAPFRQTRINKKTIWVHDDNIKGNQKEYKYAVKVKRLADGKVLKEDPTIVNE